jgi:putative membrane protein
MMNGAGWDMGFGGSLWMTLLFVAGIAIVAAFVWLAASAAASGRRGPTTDDAAQILKARFARGEITEQEYEQARRLLGVS